MPKFTVEATEMRNVKVSKISLVDRGANRLPFKIVKQEKDMSRKSLDLGSLFARKAEKIVPEVVGVVTQKSDALESVKTQIEANGFAVADSKEYDDGCVIYKQGEDEIDADKDTLIRINDNSAIVVKGFSPYCMEMENADGVSFADQCKSQGFYPGIGTAMEVTRSAIMKMARDSSDPKAAATAVAKMFNEVSAYVTGMISQLPAKAFKLEEIEVAEAVKAEEVTPAETTETTTTTTETTTTETTEQAPADVVVKTETTETVVTKNETVKGLTAEDVAAIVAKANTDVLTSVKSLIETTTKATTEAFTESLKTVNSTMESLTNRVVKAEQAVNGTVNGADTDEDLEVPAVKSERGGMGEVDTAFLPRNARKRASRA